MSKPGPYYLLVATAGERPSLFEFATIADLRSWSADRDEAPTKHNAKFLGTVFVPSDITSGMLDSLAGYESLFAELEEVKDRKRRANQRRARFNNRPNRR